MHKVDKLFGLRRGGPSRQAGGARAQRLRGFGYSWLIVFLLSWTIERLTTFRRPVSLRSADRIQGWRSPNADFALFERKIDRIAVMRGAESRKFAAVAKECSHLQTIAYVPELQAVITAAVRN